MEAALLALIGTCITGVATWAGARIGARSSERTADLANRGEEWEKIFDRWKAVLDREVEYRQHETQRIQRQVDEQAVRISEQEKKIKRLEGQHTLLKKEHSHLWELFTLAMETLSRWLSWDEGGRHGQPPTIHPNLESYLP